MTAVLLGLLGGLIGGVIVGAVYATSRLAPFIARRESQRSRVVLYVPPGKVASVREMESSDVVYVGLGEFGVDCTVDRDGTPGQPSIILRVVR